MIGLFELPEDESTAGDEHFIDVEDTPGKIIYYVFFSRSSSLLYSFENLEVMYTDRVLNKSTLSSVLFCFFLIHALFLFFTR